MNRSFKKQSFALLGLLGLYCTPIIAQDVTEDKSHYVFLIDNTYSMVGKCKSCPTNINIWPDVKKSLIDFIEDIDNDAYISIYTFAVDTTKIFDRIPASKANISSIIARIKTLKANGMETCISYAYKAVFEEILQTQGYNNSIYLYTDGNEDCQSQSVSCQDAIESWNDNKGNLDNALCISIMEDHLVDPAFRDCLEQGKIEIVSGATPPTMVKITPRSRSLDFSLSKLQTMQGFDIVNREHLPENYSVGFELQVDKMTNHNDPELIDANGVRYKEKDPRAFPCMEDKHVLKFNVLADNFDGLERGEKYEGKLCYIVTKIEGSNGTAPIKVQIDPACINVSFLNEAEPNVNFTIKSLLDED